MKSNNFLFRGIVTLALTALIFASACKKDEILDVIKFDGKKYNIAGGILENFGIAKEDPASYRMGLTFFSDGITYDFENQDFLGQGAILYANMYTSNAVDLATGTYVYDSGSKNSLTFDWGVMINDIAYSGAFPDLLTIKSLSIAGEPIEGGTIKVTKDNMSYTITFSATTSSDKSIKATYKGPLPIVDKRVSR